VPSTRALLQVLNDFVAIGYAVPLVEESALITVNDAPRTPGGPIAVLGPGTGLGEVQLVFDSGAVITSCLGVALSAYSTSSCTQRTLLQ
jgi:glucokinase